MKIEKHIFKAQSGDIKASLFIPEDSIEKLALIIPGAGYSCEAPLLYYSIDVLLQKKFKVLTIDQVYVNNPEWAKLASSDVERSLKLVEDDAESLFSSIENKLSMKIHTVVARSLGSYLLAYALEKNLFSPKQIIWQSPSLRGKWEVIKKCGIPGFVIIGSGDERYATALAHLPESKLVIESAGHAMEIANDPLRSIEVLHQVIKATSDWIKS